MRAVTCTVLPVAWCHTPLLYSTPSHFPSTPSLDLFPHPSHQAYKIRAETRRIFQQQKKYLQTSQSGNTITHSCHFSMHLLPTVGLYNTLEPGSVEERLFNIQMNWRYADKTLFTQTIDREVKKCLSANLLANLCYSQCNLWQLSATILIKHWVINCHTRQMQWWYNDS